MLISERLVSQKMRVVMFPRMIKVPGTTPTLTLWYESMFSLVVRIYTVGNDQQSASDL